MNIFEKLQVVPYDLEEKIGYGADGEVWSIRNSDKVVKFSTLYPIYNTSIEDIFRLKAEVFDELFKRKEDIFVNFSDFFREKVTFDGIVYSYVMDRLNYLSENEERYIDSFTLEEEKESSELKYLLTQEQQKKFNQFLKNKKMSRFVYVDFHCENVMKGKDDNYKFIDFDSVQIKGRGFRYERK